MNKNYTFDTTGILYPDEYHGAGKYHSAGKARPKESARKLSRSLALNNTPQRTPIPNLLI